MKDVTLLYAYYNNPQMLRRQLAEWSEYEPALLDKTDFVVVDDGSMDAPALDAVAAERHLLGGVDLQVWRVTVDKPWGQDAARNIGMKVALAPWVLMSDMDHVLYRHQFPGLHHFVKRRAARGSYYMPSRQLAVNGEPYHPHPNSFVMHRDDFWAMGGYDEDFVGFYGSDGNFRKCAKGWGLIERPVTDFKLTLFGSNVISDANTRGLTRKEGDLWAAKHPYLNSKRMGPPYRAINPFRSPFIRVL